jgi:DNA-binding transcriptional LysR family regulator
MDIETISQTHRGGLDLHHLQVIETLLRERSLTRAAKLLNVTQPALSKTLARLRRYFADPLFVRVALRMEPTPKALALRAPVAAILERMRMLRTEQVPFDPRTASRTFTFCVVDAGVIKLLPPLVNHLLAEAPQVRLRTLQLDVAHLEPWLESGNLDFAMGSFPSLTKGVRRQLLWTEQYVSAVRADHPRLKSRPNLDAFAAEKHVLVSTLGTGHAHRRAERAIEAVVPAGNILCRVPMFIGAAVLAKHTDVVATLP